MKNHDFMEEIIRYAEDCQTNSNDQIFFEKMSKFSEDELHFACSVMACGRGDYPAESIDSRVSSFGHISKEDAIDYLAGKNHLLDSLRKGWSGYLN